MSNAFAVAFDAAVRDVLIDLDDVLEIGALADDLHEDLQRGTLSPEGALSIMAQRAREVVS